MVELFRNRWLGGLFIMSIYLLSVPGLVWVTHAANNGAIFLDTKEKEVRQISDAASILATNCDLVSSCTLDCSRAVCTPRWEDVAMSNCTTVENNAFCPASGGNTSDVNNCKEMRLNYNKSYVTLPPGVDAADLQSEPVIRDICLQRGLDPTFKTLSSPVNFSYVYFGSPSGAWRAFPGREFSEGGCTNFDCRRRPWYLDGISVLKQVVILIDTGNTMRSIVTGEYDTGNTVSYLDFAINISVSLIQTMSPGDYVNVISFNSTGAYPLGLPVLVRNYNQSKGVVLHPELEPLQNSVTNLTKVPSNESGASQGASNLTAAIGMAVDNFQSTVPRDFLKLVIVFSDGYFLPLNSTTFPTAKIIDIQAKLMIYRLPPSGDVDRFLVNTTLQTVLCGVQGSFEVLEPLAAANPLYAISSYFSYLAQIHKLVVVSKPVWSNTYKSIAQDRNAVTVTSPAFDGDGKLVGVAGIDVFLHELDPGLRTDVIAEFDSEGRLRGSLAAPSTLSLICTYQNQSANQTCPSTTSSKEGIICKQSDSRSVQERVCCNTCAIPPPPLPPPTLPPSDQLETRWKILIGVVSAVAGILGVIFLTLFVHRRRRRRDSGIFVLPPSPPHDS